MSYETFQGYIVHWGQVRSHGWAIITYLQNLLIIPSYTELLSKSSDRLLASPFTDGDTEGHSGAVTGPVFHSYDVALTGSIQTQELWVWGPHAPSHLWAGCGWGRKGLAQSHPDPQTICGRARLPMSLSLSQHYDSTNDTLNSEMPEYRGIQVVNLLCFFFF